VCRSKKVTRLWRDAPIASIERASMLTHPTLDNLKAMRPDGMAEAFCELQAQDAATHLIQSCADQHSCAHLRIPMDLMRAGWLISLFQASQ